MNFSIIIPTFNEENFLPKLLKSIKKQDLNPSEIIVADNNSTDSTKKIALKYGCKVIKGGGPGEARNLGARAANSEILIFIDADVILDSKTFFRDILDSFISEDLDIASCFARSQLETNLLGKIVINGANLRKILNNLYYKTLGGLTSASGWFMIVRKDVFSQLNGFKQELDGIIEDSDFFIRAVENNFRFKCLPHKVSLSARRYEKRGIREILMISSYMLSYHLVKNFSKDLSKKYLFRYKNLKGELGGLGI